MILVVRPDPWALISAAVQPPAHPLHHVQGDVPVGTALLTTNSKLSLTNSECWLRIFGGAGTSSCTYVHKYAMHHRRFRVTVPRRCRVHRGSGSLPLALRGPRVQLHGCLRRGSSCVPEERGRASMHASRARVWDDTHTCLTNVQLYSCTS